MKLVLGMKAGKVGSQNQVHRQAGEHFQGHAVYLAVSHGVSPLAETSSEPAVRRAVVRRGRFL